MRDLAHLPPTERTDQLVGWMFGETLAPVMLRDLLAFVRSWPPAVMIHDTMEFAAPIAAEAIGAVRVAHSYGPLTFEHRMLAIAAAVTPLWEAVSADPPHYGEIYDQMYLDIYYLPVLAPTNARRPHATAPTGSPRPIRAPGRPASSRPGR